MRAALPRIAALLSVVLVTACATAVDMDSVNRDLRDQERRIAALEKKQTEPGPATTAQKLQALQQEVEALRKDFADSNWSIRDLSEKVESLKAFMQEVEQFMVQYRKKGAEIDKTLEQMTDRLEADVRSLADKLRQLLEQKNP
ncbi:MAG: hypothetical protein JSV00_04600 [bacterium]|nr:MAG: hypothetical protein JSV00_04600 [bacterium]